MGQMSTELATREQTPASVLEVIGRASADPTVDPGKMQVLVDLQIKIMDIEKKAQFDAAMARLQAKLPIIDKDKKGSNGKYASIENIDARIRPLLVEEGFHFTFTSHPLEANKVRIDGELHHKGGHVERSSITLALDKSGSKNDTQGGGSTISYGKRYLKSMMLDLVIAGEDRDGETTKRITEDQAMTIETLIGNLRDDPPGYRLRCQSKLLAAMGVNAIKDIPAVRYGEAINKLEKAAEGPQR